MRRHLFALTFVALPLAVLLSATTSSFTAHAQSSKPASAPAGIEIDALDRKIDPCTDFYQFACGGWVAKNPVPADRRSYGRFTELQERNFTVLRRILETPGGEGDRKKAADFYAACMDEPKIEAAGLTPVGPDLATIDEILNPDDLPVLIAHLHAYGIPVLFRFGAQTDLQDAANAIASVDQAGLGLPDRDYYLKTDAHSVELRDKYVAVIQKEFTAAGEPAEQAAADAKAVLSIETSMATAMLDRVKRRDPASTQHHMTINELQALSPNFNWRKYAVAAEAPPLPTINVAVPDYLRAMNSLISVNAMGDLKAYLRWHVLHQSADLLPRAFADADFDFFSRTLAGQQEQTPRWRRCVTMTDEQLGEALGKAFVDETFSPKAKADTLQMVQDIKNAMRQDIDAAPWMSGETKKAAMVKLEAVVDRIGYPDEWRDYSSVRVTRDDALGNRQRALLFNRQRNLAKIGQPVDRSEWSMTPPTVNAYYSPDRNNINFPAGILQPPFYRSGRDAAVNYGGGRRGHRARAHPRLRRSGPQVRRPGQPARLVDGGRRQGVRGARDLRRRSVLRLRGGRRHARQRPPDARREHRRQRRPAPRAHGIPGRPGREEPVEGRRLHARTARVPRLGAGVVRERAPGSGATEGGDQPALVEQIPRQRTDVQHAGVSEGVLVQGECADGAHERVQGLVISRAGGAGRAGRAGRAG